MNRAAGLRGRLPKKAPESRFKIQYVSSYLRSPLQAPTYPIDVSGGITEWGMLANGPDPTCTTHPNGVGDCTFAARQHNRMAKAATGHEHEKWETSNELVAEYLAYDHGKDKGAVIADLLLSWYRAGKILAFAPVDHQNPKEVDAAMASFHGTYVGVNLTPDADELFVENKPWTMVNGEQPNPQDGHCIIKIMADGQAVDSWVTWGAIQRSTLEWTSACLDEAWVIITEEDAKAANLDIIALKTDIDALGGTGSG